MKNSMIKTYTEDNNLDMFDIENTMRTSTC